jgi:hypothetical protein
MSLAGKPMPRARTYYVHEPDGTTSDHPTLAECGRRTAELIRVALVTRPQGTGAVRHPDVFLITGELEARDFPAIGTPSRSTGSLQRATARSAYARTDDHIGREPPRPRCPQLSVSTAVTSSKATS